MGKKREKLHKSMQEVTSKKVMKKTRTGEWVVASMLGLILLGYGVVNIGVEDTDGVEIPTEQLAEEDGATDEDPNKVVVTNDSNKTKLEHEQEEVTSEVTLGEGSVTVDLGLQNVLQPEDFGNVNNEVVTTDEFDNDSGNFVVDNKDNNNTPVEIIEDEQEVEEDEQEVEEDEQEVEEDIIIEDEKEVEDEIIIIEDEQEVEDELPKESETDIEPEDDPIIEETEPEVEEPTEDVVEEDEDKEEVVPVSPDKDKEVEETDPEVVPQPTPETPQEPTEDEQEEEVQTPVITTSTRTETEQIGYNVITRENTELAKGEERVVQVGQFGLLETVFGLTFEDGKLVLEELLSSIVITNPIDKIVEIGTYEEQAPVITTSERTETSQIKFTEVRRENPDMPLGEEKVVQEGSFGTLVKTYKVTYEDGVEVSSELVSEVVSEDPVNTIIEFGTFVQEEPEVTEPEVTEPEVVITTDTRVENETIEYEVEYIETDDLALGDKRVVQYGVDGEREIVYEQTFENGKLVNEVVVSDNVVDPIKEIIEVGTYEEPEVEITTETRTETEDIDFDVDYVESSDLLVGEERVVTEGVNGQRELVFEQTFEDGDLVDEVLVSDTVIKDAVNKVIEVGTKEVKTETNTETIDFDVIYQDNDELEVGLENTLVEGVVGEREIVTEQTFVKGELVGEEVISDTVTKDPVNKVIERGTLVVTHDIETETSDIAFETEVRENTNLEQGVTNVLQEGVNGVYTKEYELTFHNDTLVNKELITEYVSKAPVTHIIEVGTLVETQETVYETEDIDFEIVYQDNDELEVGVENVLQQGSKGELTKEYIVTKHNGHEVNRDLVGQSVTTDAVNQVIERGTLEITTKERIETEDIDFEEVRVENNTMFEDEERVVTEGVNGQRKKVYEQTFHNGVLVNEELVSNEVDSNPINKVIEYGTIKVTTGVELEEIILNYETITRENPDMETGTSRVVQEGKSGNIKRTYEVTYHDGLAVDEVLVDTQTTDPVNKIIEVGVAKVTTKTEVIEERTDFETEYRYRDDMYVDEENELQHGITGRVDITVERIYHDGVLVETVEVSRQVIATPTTQVLEVGTKERPEEPETPVEDENQPVITTKVVSTGKMISENFEVIRIANPDMLLGQEKVVQEGYNGLKVIRELVTYEDGYEVGAEFYDYQYMTETQNHIIEYGTKFEITPDGQAEYTDRVNEVLAKSDEEQYQLAIKNREILEDGLISHEESKDLLDPYYYLTKAELTALYLAVDYDKLNDEFGKLVNEHRAGLGLESLGYYEEYKTGSELISKELADYGYIAPEGQAPHTRPDDGRTTTTVFQDIDEELYNRGVGENLTFHYNLNNPYTIVSEKYLAETMFDSWMKSEGHKQNMESAVYTGYAFAIYPVMNNNTKTADRADDGGYENYREVAPHNGIGIMGTLTLIRNAQ